MSFYEGDSILQNLICNFDAVCQVIGLTYDMKVHHISLLTGDFEQNFHFYVDILGLRLVKNSINQGNIYMRHVYYGDFLGSPGSVVTFFPDHRFGQERIDGKSALTGIKFGIPRGSRKFWTNRLAKFITDSPVSTSKSLSVRDFDQIPLEFIETDDILTDWHINTLTDIPAEFQITGVLGTTLLTDHIEATTQFLKDMVGDFSAITLEKTENNLPVSKWGRGSVEHIAFAVESTAELDAIWQKAERFDYTREAYVDRGYFSSVYLLTPSGNRIEFATLTPGFTLDESVRELGTTFALPPRYEARRGELLRYFGKQGERFDEVKPAKFDENVTVKINQIRPRTNTSGTCY